MTSAIPGYPHLTYQVKTLGVMVFCTAITATASLTADQNNLEYTGQALVVQQLSWNNDDDPDEGGQQA